MSDEEIGCEIDDVTTEKLDAMSLAIIDCLDKQVSGLCESGNW
jgi:hypothetical protein